MNTPISRRLLLIALSSFTGAALAAEPPAGSSSINLHAIIAPDAAKPVKPPFFHGASVGETIVVTPDGALITARVEARVVQGEPELIPLEISGEGDIAAVSGAQLLDWSVRRDATGRRFLDLRPQPGLKPGDSLAVEIAAKLDFSKISSSVSGHRAPFSPLLLFPASAVSAELSLRVTVAEGLTLRVQSADGLVALASDNAREKLYRARGAAKLTLVAGPSSEFADPVALENFRLTGDIAGDHAGFSLAATARVREAGASCVILAGGAALKEISADAGYRVRVAADESGRPVYRLEFDKPGDFPVKLAFDARVAVRGDIRAVDFSVPAAQVAPYALTGLDAETKFTTGGAAPLADGKTFAGHLPPGGAMNLSWRLRSKAEADARLFFSTEETTDVSVGSGLLDRNSRYDFKVLQGKLDTLVFDLAGEGEVLRVAGEDILGWSVENAPSASAGTPARRLVVKLTRPHTGDYAVSVGTRNALGAFPATFTPLALAPAGAVRHGGLLRVANSGAVRLEVVPGRALTQVAPGAFPAPLRAGAAQAFVYRISSSDSSYTVHADNVLPETAVSQVAVCTLGEHDYTLDAELDVEVREAPLRELILHVPSGYAVASATAADLVDHVLSPGKSGAPAELRLAFGKPVSGRVLVKLRLEKNRAEEPEEWALPALGFPGAGSVRGFVGVCAAPGLRLTPGASAGLSEIATAFFPVKREGLQQVWRVREPGWSASMKVEKLGVAVQTDVLRQYAVREGSVAESTLVNYVIVGAPLRTLRFKIPAGATNLEFAGGEIRGWKTEGDVTEVSLQRGVSGAFTLMATCELPLNPRGGEPDLSGIRPLGVQSEQGHVLVTSDRPFAVAPKEVSKNLSEIEPGEIPPEYRMIADSPLLAAYRYSGGEYALRLALTPRGVGKTVSQVVDLASLETRVSREGGCVTTCRYLVKSRGNPHLRLMIPAELKLWTARVDGREVVPVTEGAETLVPLPPTEGPDAVTTVELRVAQNETGGVVVRPVAPAPLAPVVSTAWSFTPDAGRALVRTGGDMAQISGGAARDGLSDLAAHLRTRKGVVAALVVAAFAGFGIGALRRAKSDGSRGWLIAGLSSLAVASTGLGLAALELANNAAHAGELKFSASILEAGQAPLLKLANLPDTGFAPSAFALGALALGGVLLAGGVVRKIPALRAAGWGAALAAPLFMPGGLPLALGAGALFTFVGIGGPAFLFRRKAAVNTTVAALALLAMVAAPDSAGASEPSVGRALARAANDDDSPARVSARPMEGVAESVRQSVKLFDDRLEASGAMRVSGREGDRFDLIAAPAVLTECKLPAGVRLAHRKAGEVTVVQLVLDRAGAFTVPFAYNLAFGAESPGFPLPTGRAAADTLSVESAKPDLVFTGEGVVSVSPAAGVSSATLVYAPETLRTLRWAPRTRDARAEKLVFYSEVTNLFTPSPGALEGRHVVRIRPARGVVKELTAEIPKGLTVSGVTGEAVGTWRYDPETGLLHVSMESSRGAPFDFVVGTQAATGALPAELKLAPLVVRDAAGRMGLVGLAAGDEVRFESVVPEGLSPVNTDDFPVPASPDGSGAVVRRAFRHGDGAASVTVRIAAVEPEVRVKSQQTLSADEDRVTLNALISAEILRAGLFKLSFAVPDGFDVDSVGGPALAHWAEIREGARRVVVMHLRGRTLGEQKFTVALSGPGLTGASRWTPPKLVLNEASRTEGDLLIVPEEGLRLHPAERESATQANPGAGAKKGALAYRLLQSGYKISFDVENAAPWIKCDWLQDMTVLDGRVRGAVRFDYAVENAAVRALRVRLPENAEGVRFTGALVADAAPVAGKPGEWEVKLQRRVIGRVAFDAAFRLLAPDIGKPDTLKPAGPVDAGIRRGWLSLRTGGRLSLRPAGEPPDALRPAEWAGVPAGLRRGLDEAARTLRVVEPEWALPLAVATHDPAKLLPVRVKSAEVRSALAADGRSLSACRLELSLADKRSLRLALPEGAGLWQVFVNNRAVTPASDGKSLVVPVEPNPVAGAPATLELVYDTGAGGALKAPAFELPLENVTWRVSLPDGMRLAGWSGDLVRRENAEEPAAAGLVSGSYDTKAYQVFNDARRVATTRDADELIRLGNRYRAAGDQEQAKNALSLARSLSRSDAALNEDARVQYGNLRAEQIEFGLNRRRAQVLQDNGNFAPASQAQAAEVLANKSVNFTAEQADRLRSLNAGDDNTALRRLAERLVGLQQAGAAAPDGIRTLLPEKVRAIVFTKAMHNGAGGAPLALTVRLADTQRAGPALRMVALLAMIAGAVGLSRMLRRKS